MHALILDRFSSREDVSFKLMASMDYVFEEIQSTNLYSVIKDRAGKWRTGDILTLDEIMDYLKEKTVRATISDLDK